MSVSISLLHSVLKAGQMGCGGRAASAAQGMRTVWLQALSVPRGHATALLVRAQAAPEGWCRGRPASV